jgi:hypothetical protein
MTVHSSTQIGATPAAASLKSTATDHKKSTSTSFSKALKDASTAAEDTTAKAPSGEKSTPVEGHKYADITAGPRKGMFLNTGTTARAGQAFVMVRKNGREYHIYGTGANRHVFSIKLDDTKSSAADSSTTTDTSSATGTTDTGKINTDSSTTSGS